MYLVKCHLVVRGIHRYLVLRECSVNLVVVAWVEDLKRPLLLISSVELVMVELRVVLEEQLLRLLCASRQEITFRRRVPCRVLRQGEGHLHVRLVQAFQECRTRLHRRERLLLVHLRHLVVFHKFQS